jgi:nucleoid-associated protein YgaU
LEEYKILLQQWQEREAAAKAGIAQEDSIIAALRQQYSSLDEQISQIQQELYTMLGVYEADVENYTNELVALDNQIKTLQALTPELLYQQQSQIEATKKKLGELQQSPMANIPENTQRISEFSNRIEGLKVETPKPKTETYTVQKGDFLWKISSKPEVYGDPYKWPRIWSANADQIKNPNLIYPDQILTIIKELEKNQHLVVKGEYLAKIASSTEIYGDPFKWTKIYEANKNQIKDPNLIYPEQIIVIPEK